MAKTKPVKAKKAIKKAPKKTAAKTAAKKAAVIETKKPANMIVVTIVIAAIAVITGGIVTFFKSSQAAKETPVVSSVVNPESITLKDEASGKEFKIKQTAASVNVASSAAPAATALTVPKAAPKKAAAVTGPNKRLFEDSATKEEIPSIDITQAKYLFDSGKALFIDARGIEEYEQAHIKGSLPIPAGLTGENIPKFAPMLKDKVLVTYCHGSGCHLANKTANALFDAGYRKICIFWGGWPHWTESKFPITQKEQPKP